MRCEIMTDSLYQARGARLRVAHEAALAAQPKLCPNCGDDSDLNPTFDDDIWDCGSCGQPFEVRS